MQNNHLDIIIEYVQDQFKATCATFPTCTGFGQTEEEALDKLSQSIGNYVGRKTKSYLAKVIHSKKFRHHVIDPFEKQTQYRVYPYQPENLPFSESILIKLQDLVPLHGEPLLSDIDPAEILRQEPQDIQSDGPEEGYMLGLSLSLN